MGSVIGAYYISLKGKAKKECALASREDDLVVVPFEQFKFQCVHSIIKSDEDGRVVCGHPAITLETEEEHACDRDTCPAVQGILLEVD